MNKAMILLGIGIGAGLMYALDPQQGNRRRAVARDKLTKAMHKTGHAMGVTSRDVANRAAGLAASVHSRFFEDNAPEDVVEARVRARLGRVAAHASAIEVAVHGGVVTLDGPVFKSEVKDIVKAVSSVRGVERVENRLEAHEPGEPIPALQGRLPRSLQAGAPGEWSPAAKLAVGLAGTTLASVGMVRHDRFGLVLGGVGLALMLRAVSDVSIDRLFSLAGPQPAGESARGVAIPVRIGPRSEGKSEPLPEPLTDRDNPPGTVH